MTVHTFSSRDIARNFSAAKRAAAEGPMFITYRGLPAFVLLKIEDYFQLARQHGPSLLDVMDAIPGGTGVEFEPQPVKARFKPTNLS